MIWHTSNPLAGPGYIAGKQPTSCGLCGKSGKWVEEINSGRHECSAWECPLRKKPTAQADWPFPVVYKDEQ